jgi:ABC-type nitrate/sulfonate/bicarbonate transport system substrate-binding protein
MRRDEVSIDLRGDALSRRAFLGRSVEVVGVLGAGGMFIAACGRQSEDSASKSGGDGKSSSADAMQAAWVADAEFLGYFIAVDKGYYDKEGLTGFKVLPGGPNISPESIILGGRALTALSTPDASANVIVKKGAPLKIVGAQYQRNPIGIMSLPKHDVHEPKDLIGKTVGVPPANQLTMKALLAANEIPEDKVKVVPYQFDPTPLANGEIDAAMAFVTTDPFLLKDKGIESTTFLAADYGVSLFNDIVLVTEDDLKARRDDIIGWFRGSIRGWDDAINDKANRKQYIELVTKKYGKNLGFSYASQAFQMDAQVPLMESDATKQHGLYWMDDADIDANIETLKYLNIEASRDIFDTSVLEEVYADGPID